MVVHAQPRAATGALEPPASFTEAVTAMRSARVRPDVLVEPMPAPQRIAPFATALSADVTVDGVELGTGRLILLHDPAGNDAWGGRFRCVAYVRAEIEVETITDPMLAGVGWSWLLESLAARGAEISAPSGSVTRVATEAFGTLADDGGSAQLEIRASWTPTDVESDSERIEDHVLGWTELLCTAVGLPPVPEGVATMPARRGRRGC